MSRTVVSGARVEIFRTPLKRPFVTALGRRTYTENVGLTVRLSGGAAGYGEASTSLALKHLTAPALARTLSALARLARGKDVRDWKALTENAWRRAPEHSPAVAAFEIALLSALCAEGGTTPASWFGGARRTQDSDMTLSAWTDDAMTRAAAAEAAKDGFKTLKIKVGGEFGDDLARVRAARRGAPKARLILDGNQGLTPRGSLRLLEAVLKEGGTVDLLEQPVRKDDLKGMAFVSRRASVPVAADESVGTPAQAARVLELGAATAVNIKLAKSGVARGLEIAATARAAGVPLMIGCMAETARGLAASVHFALGTGFFRFVDLDSDVLLVEPASARRNAGWTRSGPTVGA
ncbi:MAG: dipeptide epimerase, partial [Elusimicrobia bacterium]|nr:dipeptide epimerase [Elusimicrobiota bacterium]